MSYEGMCLHYLVEFAVKEASPFRLYGINIGVLAENYKDSGKLVIALPPCAT